MKDAKKINPCPFCEGDDLRINAGIGSSWVSCHKCRAEGPADKNFDLAVKKWNSSTEVEMSLDAASGDDRYDAGYKAAMDQCIESIQAAGFKIKR